MTALALPDRPHVAIVGAGPAGLMAAERIARAGLRVTVYERMPSPGRKLLLAGRSGLNLTHAEPAAASLARYRAAAGRMRAALEAFPPEALRSWADELGADTFVGSSGRVFPRAWKASPLLRAWLSRLGGLGVSIVLRHRWDGFGPDGDLLFAGPDGAKIRVRPDAAILALGGASWPRLGSDGSWVPHLDAMGIGVEPLQPANAGLTVAWSDAFRERCAGLPLKRVAVAFGRHTVRGEAVITRAGLEGGAVYPLASALREAVARGEDATLRIDLKPDLTTEDLARKLSRERGKQSASTFLRKAAGLSPVAIGLMWEAVGAALPTDPAALAALAKEARLRVTGTDVLDRAISSAGGIRLDELDEGFMLRRRPGLFAAGEMIDWDAPTGGYLLQGCFALGAAAAAGALAWIGRDPAGA